MKLKKTEFTTKVGKKKQLEKPLFSGGTLLKLQNKMKDLYDLVDDLNERLTKIENAK